MALRKHQSQTYISRPSFPEQPQIKKPTKQAKKILTKGERFLLIGLLSAVTILALMIIQTQTAVRSTNADIQLMEKQIDNVSKENTDLSIQVSELSTYERIWKKAEELGLKLNEQNVKVVPGQ
ncbi:MULTISPECIES: cell division protein FtsL [Bacillaceae]|jgi:cell division protein FtsL|uniref:cell division protein FtsL n=1 Tax=Bacillaceae TaxID=186817 RepID=UPI0006AF2404|nr:MULTISPECIES: cell division protein FtsL [Bacillaceae]ALC86150.1 cell division protein FtsL [Bacillus sp. FJAT-22090]KQL36556.1 cell division protein FtsL [Psychrobacillus sp. FJAT-21963]MDF2068619.1 cell division protein FtsL [Bacillus sp. Cr_A10]